jgi:hypothetical protein
MMNLSNKKQGLRANTEAGRAQRAAEAMQAYRAGDAAVAAKTARLRALRLAKEAETGDNSTIKARTRKVRAAVHGR